MEMLKLSNEFFLFLSDCGNNDLYFLVTSLSIYTTKGCHVASYTWFLIHHNDGRHGADYIVGGTIAEFVAVHVVVS